MLLMLVASFGIGGFGQGGGCLGTQSQVRMIGGSSGQFLLIDPTTGSTTGLQPTFRWTAFPVDLTSYTLQIFTQSAYPSGTPVFQNTNIRRDATAFQIGASTLQPNTTYYWRVIAVDRDTGTSTVASNAPFTFNTGITPGQFNLLSPIPPSETIYSTTPTLIWSESAQAGGYTVEIDTENSFNPPVVYSTILPVTTTYSMASALPGTLSNGVTYYWRVSAFNTGGTTYASNAPAAFYVVGAPGSFLLSAPAISSTQQTITPTLSWTGATQATTYRVDISLNTSYTPTILSYSGITDTSFSVPPGVLQNGSTYYWKATAVNNVGETTATNTNPPYSFTIDVTPQSFNQSSPISASVISTLTPDFSWSISNLATEYTLEVSPVMTFTTTMVFPAITSAAYTLPAGRLSDNQTYWWRVMANNTTGVTRTASNAPLSFRTDVKPRAFTLSTVISGTTIDTLAPTFTWTISDLANEYTLQIATDIDFNSPATILGITTTSYTISGGLVNQQWYWWRVIAISNDTPITTTAANAPYRFFVDVGPRSFTLATPVTGTVFTVVTPTFTWSVSERATTYALQITSTSTSSLVYENVNIATTSFTLPSGVLSSGQNYLWSVSAANEFTTDATRRVAYNAPLIFSVNVTPAAFSLSMPISGSVMGSLTPTLQWGPSNLATTYYLQIDDDMTFVEPYRYENRGITTTSFTVPSNALEMGITYWWRVTAVNDYGQRLASNQPYAFTPTTAPLSFYLVSPSSDSIIQDSLAPTFTWTSSVYVVTYTLQISNSLSFASLVTTTPLVTSATSFQIPNGILETARTYYWRVIASNDQGQGQTIASNGPFNFTTQVLPTAFNLSQPLNGQTIYTLTPVFMWSVSTILDGYTLQVSTAATFTPTTIVYENATISSSTTAVTIPGGTLIGTTLYYWRVIARNASGNTTATNTPFQFTAGAPPGAFQLGTPVSGTVEVNLTPTLTWTYAANATGYIVEIYLDSITGTVVRNEPVGVTNTYNVQPSVLNTRRTYYWRVIAVNDYGTTTANNIEPYETIFYSVFDTFVPSTPPDPFNIASPVNGSTILSYTPMLTWNDSVGETGYTIEVATNTAFTSGLLVYTATGIARNSTSFTLTIDALPDIGTYYWRVKASNAFGDTTATNAPFAMVVDSTTSPWKPNSNASFSMFEGRVGHTAVWTGTEMLLWGGHVISGADVTYFGDGVRYNPTMDEWDYINDIGSPSTRTGHAAIWTGSEMIIWGGRNSDMDFLNDGARYSPANDTWTPLLDPDNAPISRSNHIAVWSPGLGVSGQMIVWGGYTWRSDYFPAQYERLNSGGRYDIWSDTWTSLPLQSSNQYYTLQNVWNNYQYVLTAVPFSRTIDAPIARTGEVIALPLQIIGGHTGVWDEQNRRLLIWGGINTAGDTLDTGGIWYASDNAWYEFTYPASSTPAARNGHTAVWTGSQMCIFGGNTGSIFYPINTGTILTSSDGRYTPASPRDYVVQLEPPTYRSIYNDAWTTLPAVNCPTSRTGHTALWTGTQMLTWGGYNGSYLNTGGLYRPTGNYWLVMTTTAETPVGREGHTAVWTGTEMIVWGGEGVDGYLDDGGRYNPATDSWIEVPAPMIGPPVSREFHTMVFTNFNWQKPVLDKDLATPPPAPVLNDRYLISSTGAAGAWAGYGNYLTVCIDDSPPTWDFTTPVAGMYVMVKDENSVYRYDGTSWIITTASPQVIIWGGWNGAKAFRNGSRYNPVTDNWSLLKNSGAPTARYGQTAVWTGPITTTITPTMIVWGGFNGTSYTNTGGRYDPAVGRGGLWSSLTPTALAPRAWHSAIWAYDGPNDSNEMIVWGGYNGSNYYNDGAIYELESEDWYPITSTNRPDVRMNHVAVWANTITPMQMVVWGGQSVSNNRLNTGGRYIPISDTWQSTSTPPLGFVGREGHTAAWTGAGSEEGWTTYNTVTTNDIGMYSSIVLSPSGRAHVAYYDYTSSDLKYTTNESGAWDSVGVNVDPAGNRVGEYTSIAIDSTGRLHVSYYDRTNGNLKYAISSTAFATWQTDTLDSGGDVGLFTDIAIGTGNLVHISYYDATNSALKYISGVTGSWNAPVTVDNTATVGKYTSIAADNLNKAYISYYDETSGDLKYAIMSTTGTYLAPVIVESAGDVGLYSSIGIDSINNIYISYYDITNGRLKFASNVTGAFVIENQPDSTPADHGQYCSLAVDSKITPTPTTVHISYYDTTNGRLKYISKSSVYTTTWDAPVIIDESGDVGQYSNIAVDQSKKSYISYYDNGNGDLKYATNSWTWRNKVLIWGGYDGVNYLNNGAIYDPVTDSWRDITTLNAPASRAYHNAVWSEWTDWQGRSRAELVVWGGWNGSNYLNDGAHYDPALDRWTTINSLGAPTARTYHKGLWMDFIRPDNDRTIREMMIWGGAVNGGFTQSGSRYKP